MRWGEASTAIAERRLQAGYWGGGACRAVSLFRRKGVLAIWVSSWAFHVTGS